MAEIIWITLIIVGVLLFPYFLYFWLYGFTLLKSLLGKYWKSPKNVIDAFASLNSEQRMDLETKRMVTVPQPTPTEPIQDTAWLDSPNPTQATQMRQEVIRKEGERPAPVWEEAGPADVPPLAKLP